jgi:Zn ribbon nucleic-acid-binding protein
MINRQKIIQELNLHSVGHKGWFSGMQCPWCGHEDKFGINLSNNIGSFNCWRASCAQHGTLRKLFFKINRPDLGNFERDININEHLENLLADKVIDDVDYTMPDRKLPLGYKRIYKHEYLFVRGFREIDSDRYEVGITSIDPRLKNNYIIFPIREQDGSCKGYFARSMHSKEWHDKNLEDAQQGKCRLMLRYDNSPDTDFSYYLYGINEVSSKTNVVILTEGAFSKRAVDIHLNLWNDDTVKCCSCFGQKVSEPQIKRLQDKGVSDVILMFDNNTYPASKQCSLHLSKYFNVMVGHIRKKDCDPDNLTTDEFLEVMDRLEDPFSFNLNRLNIKILK